MASVAREFTSQPWLRGAFRSNDVAFEQMGKADALHTKLFQAVHVQHKRMVSEPEFVDFAVQNGIDKAKFENAYTSFSVRTRSKANAKLVVAEDVEEVPMFTLDGRYQTSVSQIEDAYGLKTEGDAISVAIRVLDQLVDKVLAEREGAKPKKKPKQ